MREKINQNYDKHSTNDKKDKPKIKLLNVEQDRFLKRSDFFVGECGLEAFNCAFMTLPAGHTNIGVVHKGTLIRGGVNQVDAVARGTHGNWFVTKRLFLAVKALAVGFNDFRVQPILRINFCAAVTLGAKMGNIRGMSMGLRI
jgi:hypothetical protein